MKTIASVATVLSLGGAVCLVPACGTTPDICGGDRCVQGDGGGDSTAMDGPVVNPEASVDGGGGDVGPQGDGGGADGDAFTCDPHGDPSVEPCVIGNMYGLFVAPPASGGSDTTGAGTKEAPYATIGHALQNLMSKTRVYVCTATYAEAVTETAAQGASLYGGLTCPGADGGGGWVYTAGMRAKIAPTTRGAALTVTGTTQATMIADLELDAMAADSGQPGSSSIAAVVSGATGVTLTRVKLVAQGGTAGATGGAFTNNYFTGTLNGNAANGAAGGVFVSCSCAAPASASSVGGGGGSAQAASGTDGTDGTANPAATSSGANTGAKGAGEAPPSLCTNGHPGAFGAGGGAGASGTGGTLASGGWSGGSGGLGAVGDPGQGGGGGGGSVVSPGGGGGACGGCGGGTGVGGTGGGASIALALVNSMVTVVSCDLVTAAGGTGGAGSGGEAGQGGGTGGTAAGGCGGANGGQGGGGGGGGGGSGGPSVGIAFTGTTTLTVDGKALTANAATLGGPSSYAGGAAGGGGAGGGGGLGASVAYNGATGATGLSGASGAVETF